MANGTTQLGPGCFMDVEGNVINYQGQNFYRACDEVVFNNPHGGVTYCIKPVGHKSSVHEDSRGHTIGGQQSFALEE
jgi:hypothetical protein